MRWFPALYDAQHVGDQYPTLMLPQYAGEYATRQGDHHSRTTGREVKRPSLSRGYLSPVHVGGDVLFQITDDSIAREHADINTARKAYFEVILQQPSHSASS